MPDITVVEVVVAAEPEVIEVAIPGAQGPQYGNVDGGSAATNFVDSMTLDCGGA